LYQDDVVKSSNYMLYVYTAHERCSRRTG
jgi:hypothetical protein